VPVVIDGNNLLYAAREAEALSPLVGRSMLCDTVGRWAQLRRERVHIVFDGPAPPAPLARQIGNPAIEVSYSGGGQTADAVLMLLLETDSAARRILVVSSDRAIIRAAKRRRAHPIRSEDFWISLKRDLARPVSEGPEPKEKEAGLSPPATDAWLDLFGLNEPADQAGREQGGLPGADDEGTSGRQRRRGHDDQ
jgi:predicted RNA-binding protein with PIN domain